MAKKDTRIIIDGNDFIEGIGESPLIGNQQMRGVSITDMIGTIQPVNPVGSSLSQTIVDMTQRESDGAVVALNTLGDMWTYNGTIWTTRANGTTITGVSCGGLNEYTYFTDSGANKVGYMNLAGTFTNAWQSINESTTYPFYLDPENGYLYLGHGNDVAQLDYDGSYNWTESAIDLPSEYRVTAISSMGSKLLIGTEIPIDANTNRATCTIFPWDKISGNYDNPLILAESGISQMYNVNNLVYIVAGKSANLYVTDGYRINLVKDINALSNCNNTNLYYGGITYFQNKLWIGFNFAATSAQTEVRLGSGIYSIALNKPNNPMVNEFPVFNAANEAAWDKPVYYSLIGSSVNAGQPTLLIAAKETSIGTHQVYNTGVASTSKATSISTFISKVYNVGTLYQPRTFEYVEIFFKQATSATIKLYYREYTDNPATGWTQIGSDISGSNSKYSVRVPFGQTMDNIQFKITTTGEYSIKSIIAN